MVSSLIIPKEVFTYYAQELSSDSFDEFFYDRESNLSCWMAGDYMLSTFNHMNLFVFRR